MRRIILHVLAIFFCCEPLLAVEMKYSGKSGMSDNPFLAYGYNPKTNIVTGYLVALRTAPGRTHECKLVFSGNVSKKNEFIIGYLQEGASSNKSSRLNNRIILTIEKGVLFLRFPKRKLEGDCNWVLPWVVESELIENQDDLMVEVEVQIAGDWISVYAIGAEKAKFYGRPDQSSAKKGFLVKGDIIYDYDEQPEWYYVKYVSGKRKTVGWIRKSDTLQP